MLQEFVESKVNKANKQISVFWVMCPKILGRVGTHFFKYFFSGKNI